MIEDKKVLLDDSKNVFILETTRKFLVGFLLLLLSIISFLPNNGFLGKIINYVPVFLFGNMYLVIIVFIASLGLVKIFKKSNIKSRIEVSWFSIVGLYLFVLIAVSKTAFPPQQVMVEYRQIFASIHDFNFIDVLKSGVKGGSIGIFLYAFLNSSFGEIGVSLIYILGICGCLFLILRPLIYNGVNYITNWIKTNKNVRVRNKYTKSPQQDSIPSVPELTMEEKLSRIKVEDHNLRHVQKVNRFFIKEEEIKIPPKVTNIEILVSKKQESSVFQPSSSNIKSQNSLERAEAFNVFKDPVFLNKEKNKQQEEIQRGVDKSKIFFDFNKPEREIAKPTRAFVETAPKVDFFQPQVAKSIERVEIQDDDHSNSKEPEIEVVQINEHEEIKSTYQIKKEDNYRFPPIDILKQESIIRTSLAKATADVKAELLNQKLDSFGIDAHVKEFIVAPAFTRFIVELGNNAKMQQFNNVKNDLMGALSAEKINILTPIPGSQYVGVEIPNKERSTVSFKDVLLEIPFEMRNKKLLVALGKNIIGDVITTELNKAPHMLIAGQTGSGKSVCINTIIVGLLMRCHPDDVKLILVDPKRVELSIYSNIPHLLCPVISDPKKAAVALSRLVEEIEDRYKVLEASGYKNIETYNAYAHENKQKKFPYIVTIIDELADLMLVASKMVEDNIRRITAIARAAGIHLIVATQRPSVDVITGVIKANIPTRLAFAVSSGVDSRTILDEIGAEELLGNGDLMFRHPNLHVVERIQGAFVSDSDIEAVVDFVKKQAKPNYDEKFMNLDMLSEQLNLSDSLGFANNDSEDEYYQEVLNFLKTSSTISTSSLQRKFSIGFQRAGRIIDRLENDGFISSANGSKPREIYREKIGDR